MLHQKPIEAVEQSLDAIDRGESRIHAWVRIDPDEARRDAFAATEQRATGRQAPLAGVTVGVKDIFDTARQPTIAGFAPFEADIARRDSAVVHRLRAAGAAIVGKTTTTQFASSDPTETRNPWNLDRTPGGSSSGSAAAVAARHVDLGIGSQTAGSTLRPAAFCGVIGFKPSWGWTSREGMVPLAHSLDTGGLIAHDIEVIDAAYHALASAHLDRLTPFEPTKPARLGIWRDPTEQATDEARKSVELAVTLAGEQGVEVIDVSAPAAFTDMLAVHHIIMLSEAGAGHVRLIHRHGDDYAPRIRSFVETGAAMPASAYARAIALRDQYLAETRVLWSDCDVVLLPTADGPAPTLETTGNPALQAIATLLGLPSISLPVALAQDGMPLGVQLISPRRDGNARLLRAAFWLTGLLPILPVPAAIADLLTS